MNNVIRDKDYFKAASKKSYLKHREKILEQRKKLWEEKKEILNERNLNYYYDHQEECKDRQTIYRETKKLAKELAL
jgi:hypothetical protein